MGKRVAAEQVFSMAACLLMLLFAPAAALAGQVAVGSGAEQLPATVVAWAGLAGMLVQFLLNVVSPTTATPWGWSPKLRGALAVALSAAAGGLQMVVSGSSWREAAGTAIGALVMGLVGHGASEAIAFEPPGEK